MHSSYLRVDFVLKGIVYLCVYACVSEPVCLIGMYKHTETQAVESGQALWRLAEINLRFQMQSQFEHCGDARSRFSRFARDGFYLYLV